MEIIDKWLNLLSKEFDANPEMCIGVHCVTGLGRAPVLVAVALIELGKGEICLNLGIVFEVQLQKENAL